MISTVNHYSAYAYFNFGARTRYAYAYNHPRARGFDNYFTAGPLLGWRSDGVYLSLRANAGRGLAALHFCWRTLRNHGRLALISLGSDHQSRAWRSSCVVSGQCRWSPRDGLPRLRPAPWWQGEPAARSVASVARAVPGSPPQSAHSGRGVNSGTRVGHTLGAGLSRALLRVGRAEGSPDRSRGADAIDQRASLQARLTRAYGRGLAQIASPRDSGGLSNPDSGLRSRITVRPDRPDSEFLPSHGADLGPMLAPAGASSLSLLGPRSDFLGAWLNTADPDNRQTRRQPKPWAMGRAPTVVPERNRGSKPRAPELRRGRQASSHVWESTTACAQSDRGAWARNPNLSQVDLIVFADPSRTPGLVKQARQLRIPSLSLDAGLRRAQDVRRCAGNPSTSFELLGNPENGWLSSNLSLTLLKLGRIIAGRRSGGPR